MKYIYFFTRISWKNCRWKRIEVCSFDEWHAVLAQLFHVADAHINGKKEKNMARLLALIFVFKDLLHGLPLKLTYIILTRIVIMRSTNNREFHSAFGKIGLTMAFMRYTMQGREWKKIFLICLTVHAGEWENLKKRLKSSICHCKSHNKAFCLSSSMNLCK